MSYQKQLWREVNYLFQSDCIHSIDDDRNYPYYTEYFHDKHNGNLLYVKKTDLRNETVIEFYKTVNQPSNASKNALKSVGGNSNKKSSWW